MKLNYISYLFLSMSLTNTNEKCEECKDHITTECIKCKTFCKEHIQTHLKVIKCPWCEEEKCSDLFRADITIRDWKSDICYFCNTSLTLINIITKNKLPLYDSFNFNKDIKTPRLLTAKLFKHLYNIVIDNENKIKENI